MITLALPVEAVHPAYAGHFPGRPILPGVVLLERAQSAIENASGLTITGIAMAKFLSPARPGEALLLDYEATEAAFRFEIRCGERRIATGRFAAAQGS